MGYYKEDKFNYYIKIIKDNNSDIKLFNNSDNTLTFEEYKGVKFYYYIKCDICGEYVRKTLDNTVNNKCYTCNDCASKITGDKNKLSFKMAIKRVELLNSEMRLTLSHSMTENEWNKVIDKYWLKCSKCGKWIFREYRAFVDKGGNLCGDCGGQTVWDICLAKDKIKELGSELLADEWLGVDNKYSFKCVRCGNITNKTFDKFVNSNQRLCDSCSCSKGEDAIRKELKAHNIKFISQYKFDDLRGKNKQFLKFDVGILDDENNLKFLIEYQGEQHYFPVDFANKGEAWAKNQFEKNKYRDKIKIEYCKNNSINLLEIPYWDYKNINSILGGLLWEKESQKNI